MANNLTDEQVDKIAQAIAAKMAKPGGPAILGCGSASSSQNYSCGYNTYECSGSRYECGGAGAFRCPGIFICDQNFQCDSYFHCESNYFYCDRNYSS